MKRNEFTQRDAAVFVYIENQIITKQRDDGLINLLENT